MKSIAKPLIAATALLAIAIVPGCGGPNGQPPAAKGGSTASAAGADGNGTSTTGNSLEQTPTTPGTSPPPDTGTTAPATSNNVILGAQFAGGGPKVSFGRILPGQSTTLPFELDNIGEQSITVVSITSGDAAFSPSTECNGQTMDPGGSCTFSVTFSPADSGDYNSYLDVAVAAPGLGSTGTTLAGSAGSPSVASQTLSPPPSQLAPSQPVPAGSSSP